MKIIRLLLIFIALPAFAFAEEYSVYSPEECEFSVTFPEAPHKSRRCDDERGKKCYDQISYTKVYQLSSTVNFRVICNPVNEEIYSSYSGKIMEATLKAMTDSSVVKTFDTSYREEKGYKQAGLVGEGKVGRTPTIYIAQLWIGKRSALSVEAELIGDKDDAADKLFSEVLKSIYFNQENPAIEDTVDKIE